MLTKKIIEDLLSKDLVKAKTPKEELLAEAEKTILDELMVEDKVNDEVREILKKYTSEIERGRLDYRKMFDLTKRKIIEERGLVI